jgi:hypothetical protein
VPVYVRQGECADLFLDIGFIATPIGEHTPKPMYAALGSRPVTLVSPLIFSYRLITFFSASPS